MKLKKRLSGVIALIVLMQSVCSYAYSDMSIDFLREKQLEFASKYDYHEGDFDISFNLYPGIDYTSGIEQREDGTEYECPAIYVDDHAVLYDDFSLRKGEAKLLIDGKKSLYYDMCILYNSRTLIPVDAFIEAGLNVSTDYETYVTTISKGETVLEILPYLIGMRKNGAEGFYVPLEACARIVDDTLYVPLRAVSDEFGLSVGWDGDTKTVYLNNIPTN